MPLHYLSCCLITDSNFNTSLCKPDYMKIQCLSPSNILKNTHFRAIFLSCCLPRKHNGHLNFFPLPDTFLENVTFLAVFTSCLSMKHYTHYFFLFLKPSLCFWIYFCLFSCILHQGVFFGLGAFSEFRITAFKHSESLLQQKVKRKATWRNSTLAREMNLCSLLWACLQTASSDRIAPSQHISVSVMAPCPHMQSVITYPWEKILTWSESQKHVKEIFRILKKSYTVLCATEGVGHYFSYWQSYRWVSCFKTFSAVCKNTSWIKKREKDKIEL